MRQGSTARPPGPLSCGLILCLFALWPPPRTSAATTDVYRCVTPEGATEFRQGACDAGTDQSQLTVEDQPTGWVPTEPTRSSRETKSTPKKKASTARSAPKSSKADERQCWEKRQKLDEVNWRLRRGYEPKQGTELRRKRDYYEDFLDQFCP